MDENTAPQQRFVHGWRRMCCLLGVVGVALGLFATSASAWQSKPEPPFSIEKVQEIQGSGAGFTRSELTGKIGQTVDYQIIVRNTGNTPLKLTEFSDAHCDAGTLAGGPGSSELGTGDSTTYTCHHVLTEVGAYSNSASVTGT